MLSSNSLKSAPVFAEIMWSQDGRKVQRCHGGKGVTLRIVDVDSDHNFADGHIETTVNNIISKDNTELSPADYDTMKYVKVIDSGFYEDGIDKIDTKGELAYEFYKCLFEEKLGGGGNVTIGNCNDIEMIVKNIPKECITANLSDKIPASGQAEATEVLKSDLIPTGELNQNEIHKAAEEAADDKPLIGVIKYKNGDVYEGEIKNGKPNGQGTMTYPNGEVYEGNFEDGRFQGHGVIKYKDGAVFEGEFKNDKPIGQGVYTYSQYDNDMGAKSIHQFFVAYRMFSNGNFKGLCTLHKRFFGRGCMQYKNGDTYTGEFKNGNQHGHGKMTYADGTVKDGKWKNGKFMD